MKALILAVVTYVNSSIITNDTVVYSLHSKVKIYDWQGKELTVEHIKLGDQIRLEADNYYIATKIVIGPLPIIDEDFMKINESWIAQQFKTYPDPNIDRQLRDLGSISYPIRDAAYRGLLKKNREYLLAPLFWGRELHPKDAEIQDRISSLMRIKWLDER